jgi:hypothetical protein
MIPPPETAAFSGTAAFLVTSPYPDFVNNFELMWVHNLVGGEEHLPMLLVMKEPGRWPKIQATRFTGGC